MGYYTSIRGWLNVEHKDSSIVLLAKRLEEAKTAYSALYPESRDWIYRSTCLPVDETGFDGSVFIFIGCRLKNYDDDWRRWLTVLLEYFPWADGRWDVQSEDQDYATYDGDSASAVLTVRISEGSIKEDYSELAWCSY